MRPKFVPKLIFGRDLKVAFIQKGLMCLSYLQTDKLNYFPEVEL